MPDTERHGHDTADEPIPADQLLSAREVAERLGVSNATVTRRVHAGILVPVRTDPLLFDARRLPGVVTSEGGAFGGDRG